MIPHHLLLHYVYVVSTEIDLKKSLCCSVGTSKGGGG